MPIADCGFFNSETSRGADTLLDLGPTVFVDVGFDADFNYSADLSHPASQATKIPALVDTGAVLSCIDGELADRIGLPVIDTQTVAGVGGATKVNVYLGHVHIPSLDYTQWGRFAGVRLAEGGQVHQVLIGRSVLRDAILVYDGRSGAVQIAR